MVNGIENQYVTVFNRPFDFADLWPNRPGLKATNSIQKNRLTCPAVRVLCLNLVKVCITCLAGDSRSRERHISTRCKRQEGLCVFAGDRTQTQQYVACPGHRWCE